MEVAATRRGYRADIDGLRAVAVLLVLLYHVGVRSVPGGFVGVDVFFVISGYLISAHILHDAEAGRFSLRRFYERRMRRILPALLVMLAVVSLLAYKVLFPFDLAAYGQAAAGALFSVSNVVLLHQTGYFLARGKEKLLLHTWSLGVEEQFYIVFPLLFVAMVRWAARSLRAVLWVLTVLLFALAIVWTAHAPEEAFYLAPFRAWEFLAGTLLAARALPAMQRGWQRQIAAGAGLLLILLAGVTLTDAAPFPGWRALLPCVGAALVIAAGEEGTPAVSHLLAVAPVRSIGLISYSLYLWHWPVQVLQATNDLLVPDRYPAWMARAAVIAVSFLLAALSWRFVEQPLRTGRFRTSRLALYVPCGVLFGCVLLVSVAVIRYEGFRPPHMPWPGEAVQFGTTAPRPEQIRSGECFVEQYQFPAAFQAQRCLAGDTGGPQVLLLGDSHAAHLFWGLKTVFPAWPLSMVTVAGCPPVFTAPAPDPPTNGCDRERRYLRTDLLQHRHFDTAILTGRWTDWDVDQLTNTIAWLKAHGTRVVVIGPGLEYNRSMLRLVVQARREHDPAIFARHLLPELQTQDRKMQRLAREVWQEPYVSVFEDLCRPAGNGSETAPLQCPVTADSSGTPLLYDTDHLTMSGSILLAKAMRDRGQLP